MIKTKLYTADENAQFLFYQRQNILSGRILKNKCCKIVRSAYFLLNVYKFSTEVLKAGL